LTDHLLYLREIFQRLWHYNVVLNSKKAFLDYSFIIILNQIINVFDLIIAEKKLTIIIKLTFSINLKKLETYLNLIEYFRVYVSWYSQVTIFTKQKDSAFQKQFDERKISKVIRKKDFTWSINRDEN
jgi:hypothetical protein